MTKQTYPELRDAAQRIFNETAKAINVAAANTKSAMPYKSQFILEELIKLLQQHV